MLFLFQDDSYFTVETFYKKTTDSIKPFPFVCSMYNVNGFFNTLSDKALPVIKGSNDCKLNFGFFFHLFYNTHNIGRCETVIHMICINTYTELNF